MRKYKNISSATYLIGTILGFMCLGFAGSLENDTITLMQFVIYEVLTSLAIFACVKVNTYATARMQNYVRPRSARNTRTRRARVPAVAVARSYKNAA